MASRHRRRVWLTFRRLGPAAAIVVFLVTVAVTYPRPSDEGVVMPPGVGTYENYGPVPLLAEPTEGKLP